MEIQFELPNILYLEMECYLIILKKICELKNKIALMTIVLSLS
jgi:hypothetical protein